MYVDGISAGVDNDDLQHLSELKRSAGEESGADGVIEHGVVIGVI